jgi:RND family efflux transporter MFP subunit
MILFGGARTPDVSSLRLIAAPALAQDAAKKSKRPSGTLVHVDAVRSVPMAQTMPLVGRLVAVRAGIVAARIDAPVAEMKVDIGESVTKGQVIALLADDRLRLDRAQKAAEVAAAEAAVNTALARLALAEQELKRFSDLRSSAAFPRARFDDKRVEVNRLRTEINEARAKVEKAKASLKLTETELSYSRIAAPYDGTITRRHTEMGSYVKEGQAVYTMVSDRNLELEADVPASRVGALAPGSLCTFELGKGKTFQAVVRAIVPYEDPRTRTRTVRFTPRFEARPDALAANQSATIHIPIGKGRDVLSVHKDALVPARGQPTVFVAVDGRAQLRTVRVGEAVGARFEVLNGLNAGEMVVVRGNERLRDGSRIRVNGTPTQ